MLALTKPGDTIMGLSLDAGGHLTHGSRAAMSGSTKSSSAGFGQWSVCRATVTGWFRATSVTNRAIASAPVARAFTPCPAK